LVGSIYGRSSIKIAHFVLKTIDKNTILNAYKGHNSEKSDTSNSKLNCLFFFFFGYGKPLTY
jgi:hypothetical protein